MTNSSRRSEIQRVLLITLAANLLVAAAKIIVGLLTSSLAMVADGIHSSLDGTSNIIGLITNLLASRPPDEKHPYGHRRFETLASMMIGGILLLTGWEIIKGAIQHLSAQAVPQISTQNFVVMIVTVLVNTGVTLYEQRAGQRLNSEFLLADAAHTRSDILVSLTVLASLIAVTLGLTWIDAVAAIVVVGLIAMVAWRIVSHSAGILVDRVALNPNDVTKVIENIAGVQEVARVRSRGPSDEVHLDLDLQIAGATTAEHSTSIAREVRSQLRSRFSGLSDIQVNFLPSSDAPNAIALAVRAEADALGLGVHEIITTPIADAIALEMHVEVPREQSIGEAHTVVTELEHRLHGTIRNLERIVTHIEPTPVQNSVMHHNSSGHAIARKALKAAQDLYPGNRWHDVEVRMEPDGGYALSMHCHVSADMPLEDAHHLAESVETQLRASIPQLHRVTIHTEPPDAA